jgi:hypothetical protein
VTVLQKIIVITLCIYFILGAMRYFIMDPRLLAQWEDETVKGYRARRLQHPMPSKRVREFMFFLYVLFFWYNTIGMQPKPEKEDEDDGNS